ncbi:MAG: hypothetical protein JNM18_25535 [Planctomycetaceae bacterium]|nr:hypothetical protein [Planctomycetaceae bacterium]
MSTAKHRRPDLWRALQVAPAGETLNSRNLLLVEPREHRGNLFVSILRRLADRNVRGTRHCRKETQCLESNSKLRLVQNQFAEHVAKLRCPADSPQRRANDAGKERRVAQFLTIVRHILNDLANRVVSLLGAVPAMVGAMASSTDRRTLERFSSPIELGHRLLVVASTAKLRLYWR